MMDAKVVAYGRRKGRTQSLTESSLSADQEISPSQIAVLPFSEWKRIKAKFSSWQDPVPSRAVEERRRKEALHEQSRCSVQHWENTIEGQRLKRLEARKHREVKDEKERVKIDEEEAKFQAEKRKIAIERAKTLLYYQTDRVKQLNGALVLSEVLRERGAQLSFKKKRQDLFKTQDGLFRQFQEKEREKAAVRDMQAAEERAKETTSLARFHLKQSEGKSQKCLEERMAALEEQKRLDEEALEQHLQRKELHDEHIKKRAEFKHELDAVVEDKRKAETAERQQIQTDEERIEIYTKAKKQMDKLRKEKQAEVMRDFQAHQKFMCDNLQEHMESVASDEDQRIAQIVQNRRAKRDAELRAKQLEYISASKDIHKHMLEQIASLAQEKKEQEKIDQLLLKQRIIQDQKFHNNQLERQQWAHEEASSLQQFHVAQAEEIKARIIVEEEDNLTYNKRNLKLLQVEETQFQQYADQVISEAKARGGSLQPLRTAAKEGAGGGHGPMLSLTGVRPSYQTRDSDAKELPSHASHKPKASTQKRLGFIW